MRVIDWSSDVCSSDLKLSAHVEILRIVLFLAREDVSAPAIALILILNSKIRGQVLSQAAGNIGLRRNCIVVSIANVKVHFRCRTRRLGDDLHHAACRSEEHTSELQSLMRISYAVFCLKKKHTNNTQCAN